MKYFITIYFLSIFSVFSNGYLNYPTPIVEKANQQTMILEMIVKAYIQLNSNPSEIREDINNNSKLFNQNIDDLFLHAEDHGIEMIRLVGAQYNTWEKIRETLDLPSTKINQERIMKFSMEIVKKNDEILDTFRPVLLKASIDSSFNRF